MSLAVTLLYFDGCPSWRTVLDRLPSAAALVGVRITVSTEVVESILIGGHDPFAEPGMVPAMACRVYVTPQGLAGSPTVDQLAEALKPSVD